MDMTGRSAPGVGKRIPISACLTGVLPTRSTFWLAPVAPGAEGLVRELVAELETALAEPDAEAGVPAAVFSQPPLGTVGLTEAEAREQGFKVDIYRSSFRGLKQTLTSSRSRTLMKLVVDQETDRVLGAHMAGHEAAEIIQGLAVAVKAVVVTTAAAEAMVAPKASPPALDVTNSCTTACGTTAGGAQSSRGHRRRKRRNDMQRQHRRRTSCHAPLCRPGPVTMRRHAKHLAPGDRLRFASCWPALESSREKRGLIFCSFARVASVAHLMRRHMIASKGP